jgi:cytidine deaminase
VDPRAEQLIAAARELVERRCDDQNHTVAAAVLTSSGTTLTSMNLHHFTGGPDAEVAVLARVVSEGEEPLLIVAVGHDGRGVVPPCGRCRQVMLDYFPSIEVVMADDGRSKTVAELLPDAYVRHER